jgi:hypothetical protein
MKANFGVVCDYAYIDAATQKLSILGVFRFVNVGALPAVIRRMCIAVELEAPMAESNRGQSVSIELVDQDGSAVLTRTPPIPVKFMPIGVMSHGIGIAALVLELDLLQLPHFGTYTVHVFNQTNQSVVSVPFHIQQTPTRPALPAST